MLAGVAGMISLRPMSIVTTALRGKLWWYGARGGFVLVGGVWLHYLRAPAKGRASAVPLLLIHGLGARSLDWTPVIPGLQAAGHEVYAVDLPGYGLSERPDAEGYSIGRLAGSVLGLMDALGLERVDVAGWSMGGWVAMKVASDRPERVRRLVLIDSAGLEFDVPYEPSIFAPTDVAGVRRLLARLTPKKVDLPGFVARDVLRRMRANGCVLRRNLEEMLGGADLMEQRLSAIDAPTMVLWGEQDELIPLEVGERIAVGIAGAEMVRVPGCGHLAPMEQPAEILTRMTEFLRDESRQELTQG